MKQLMGTQATA